MKTAISLPDLGFEEAELLAKQLGMSRSELYTKALKAYLCKYNYS
jgi:metal-responsive CopG/Arc/MetJ family transcriptional regulator